MAAQNKKELQEIKSLQQELNNILEKREESGEKVTRGLKKEIKMYNTLVEKGKDAVEQGLISSKQAKDQAKILLKVAKTKNDIISVEEALSKAKTDTERALQLSKLKGLRLEHAAGVVAEKSKTIINESSRSRWIISYSICTFKETFFCICRQSRRIR